MCSVMPLVPCLSAKRRPEVLALPGMSAELQPGAAQAPAHCTVSLMRLLLLSGTSACTELSGSPLLQDTPAMWQP